MGFGVWYEDDGNDASLIDSQNQKLSLVEARDRVRHVLKDKDKDELLGMLLDRLDIEDIMRYVADGDNKLLSDPRIEEQAMAEVQKTALSGAELAKLASKMPKPTGPWVDHPDDIRPSRDGSELDVDYEKS